jgi:hypothetical protein
MPPSGRRLRPRGPLHLLMCCASLCLCWARGSPVCGSAAASAADEVRSSASLRPNGDQRSAHLVRACPHTRAHAPCTPPRFFPLKMTHVARSQPRMRPHGWTRGLAPFQHAPLPRQSLALHLPVRSVPTALLRPAPLSRTQPSCRACGPRRPALRRANSSARSSPSWCSFLELQRVAPFSGGPCSAVSSGCAPCAPTAVPPPHLPGALRASAPASPWPGLGQAALVSSLVACPPLQRPERSRGSVCNFFERADEREDRRNHFLSYQME